MKNNTMDKKLAKTLISFSLPLILSGFLQQLYNWADAFIVGNIEGEVALAAIGATSVVSNLFIMAITGFTSGISILSARYYEDKDISIQKKILVTFMVIAGVFFTISSSMTVFFVQPILIVLKTPVEIYETSKNYLAIILLGVPFMAVYNVYVSVLRGMGDSKMSFYAVLVSAVINIFLDVLFVFFFRWGAEGAALATIISQLAMTIFIVFYARKKHPCLKIRVEKLIYRKVLKSGGLLALPITIQSVLASIGNLGLQNFMNGFGTVTVAAITTAYRVDALLILPVINLGTGVAIITSQNIGQGKYKEAKRSLVIGLKLSAVISLALTLLVVNFGENVIDIFGVSDASANIGGQFFRL
jgi:putative MATE family efflux protein